MQRSAYVLIAVLAAVALVTAAGSFDAASGPSLDGGEDVEPGTTPAEGGAAAGGDGDGSSVSNGAGSGVDDSDGGDGGLSWLFVVLFVGALGTGALLIVVLSGDDERAPPRDDEGDDAAVPTGPIRPPYGSPGDGAVVRAWRRLAERVDDGGASATPAETAAAAVDRGLSADSVDWLTRQFRSVRYGRERSSAERERRAERIADELALPRSDATGDDDDSRGNRTGERDGDVQ